MEFMVTDSLVFRFLKLKIYVYNTNDISHLQHRGTKTTNTIFLIHFHLIVAKF